ncbi:hypothetical protein ACFYP4_09865 [Streptomyces sp. NPDC005551]|uniref:hypothetical protein n=1 Tax=unclassified Streptomyces TaxID=2593676 RepID=UPI003403CC81
MLRLITEQRISVCLTVHANGRRRYGYWQPVSSAARRGGCYVALPTDECDALHAAGRLVLGEPVVDPSKTTYPVRVAESRTAGPVRVPEPRATYPVRVAGRSTPSVTGAPQHALTA